LRQSMTPVEVRELIRNSMKERTQLKVMSE
jgi:hypothetical protein